MCSRLVLIIQLLLWIKMSYVKLFIAFLYFIVKQDISSVNFIISLVENSAMATEFCLRDWIVICKK